MLGELILAARDEGDITEQKSLQQTYDFIADPFYLLFGIGLSQLLDSFSQASVNSQKLWNFPGSIVESLSTLNKELEEQFHWRTECLEFVGRRRTF